MLAQLNGFHKTKRGLFILGVIGVALALLLVNHALDSGNWWEYALALIAFVGAMQNIATVAVEVLRYGRQ